MPQIMIRERQDRSGAVKLNLGTAKGSIYKELPREKKITVSEDELEALMHSHEGKYTFVYPEALVQEEEVADVSVGSSERAGLDSGGDAEGSRKGRKFR